MLIRMSSLATLVSIAIMGAGCGDDTGNLQMDAAAPGDMAMSSTPTCADYCAKIQMNCTVAGVDGGHGTIQYPSAALCNTYCTMVAAWPTGMTGDTMGNTIGCRLYHAGAASGNAVLHCPHAGTTGGGMCGSYCDNYCQLMAKNCTGANMVYDAATCMTKCATIPTTGFAGDTSGNTIQCRIYHGGAAFANPVLHCPHLKTAADLPGGPCT
jgi:hypothetical protein